MTNNSRQQLVEVCKNHQVGTFYLLKCLFSYLSAISNSTHSLSFVCAQKEQHVRSEDIFSILVGKSEVTLPQSMLQFEGFTFLFIMNILVCCWPKVRLLISNKTTEQRSSCVK